MVTASIIKVIQSRAEGRFVLQTEGSKIALLLALAPEQLLDCKVARLSRVGYEHAGWRTLLIASLENEDKLKMATRWAANVRDSLQEPETADLYLFLSVKGLSIDTSASIEASEQFCRKFVIRPGENPEALVDRTFLAQLFTQSAENSLTDPLMAALSHTKAPYPWFDCQHQKAWRNALLSGMTGSDLAKALLDEVPNGGDIS